MKLYIAHPISGLSGEEILEYYSTQKAALSQHFNVLYPMLGKEYLRNDPKLKAHGFEHPLSKNHAIVERDCWMVSNADIVLVDLLGAKNISIGCMMELAWAHMLRKHTVVVMEKDNVHAHAFVFECADVVFFTWVEAYNYLVEISKLF